MANPLGSAPGIMIGVGVGTAASAAIEPLIEPGRQKAWQNAANKVLDPGLMAALVAQGGVDLTIGQEQAARAGFAEDKFNRLVYLAQKAPDLAVTLELWRRGLFGDPTGSAALALVDHALAKEQIEAQYWPAIKDLFGARLDPAVIATAIQRGIMSDPFNLPDSGPLPAGNVPPFPTSPLDPLLEAQAAGINEDRLFVERAIVGLPLALVEAAQATFRGIITEDDFQRAVREGNTRNEWGPAALEVSREILTAHDYAELQLRGYLTRDERLALTAQHGMTDANSDLLYDVLGRAPAIHQILIGLRRGGTYQGPTDGIPPEYLSALERGNIRPEYYNLAYAGRESFPSYFVIRPLVQSGAITEERATELFMGMGWPEDVAKLAPQAFTSTSTSTTTTHVTKAETQLWTALHKSYIAQRTGDTQARTTLTEIGVPAASQDQVLKLWGAERQLVFKELTPTQIKKATDPPYDTPALRLAALVDRGYTQADAQAFLDE